MKVDDTTLSSWIIELEKLLDEIERVKQRADSIKLFIETIVALKGV